jgi:hypothetical protein
MCTSARRHYAATTAAPASAREFGAAIVIASLHPSGWRLADDVEIVVSELVSESLACSSGPIGVEIDLHYDRLTLAVEDDRGHEPAASSDAGDDDTRRLILAGLTEQVETTHIDGDGTVTRASIACDPLWTARVPCDRRPAALA